MVPSCHHQQLVIGRGCGHIFGLDYLNADNHFLPLAVTLVDPGSGRILDVATALLGIQVYSGYFFNCSEVGTSDRMDRVGDGIALETQHFPSNALRPGEEFTSTTVYAFSTT
jgi:aldose 1-epimerase